MEVTDIHAIIAAATSELEMPYYEYKEANAVLYHHAIAMAEALARIRDKGLAVDAETIARDCLDRIVKEANRG